MPRLVFVSLPEFVSVILVIVVVIISFIAMKRHEHGIYMQ